jgi:two-component system, chemotaxis family, protein-glutamate methylesterase/glutaminase
MDDSGFPPPHGGRAMPGAEPSGTPSGYVCPRCGGSLWERRDGEDPAFECRIGHPFEALELWVAHCTTRNAALEAAARALAENAALARKLAVWSRERGNVSAVARIEEEAAVEEQYYEQVRSMLEGLEPINSAQ